jgi:hypothetical protein
VYRGTDAGTGRRWIDARGVTDGDTGANADSNRTTRTDADTDSHTRTNALPTTDADCGRDTFARDRRR